MGSELVKPHHLGRRAVIYVRQSTPHQVLSNQESLRLQDALRQRARELGWREAEIDVIDADLGLSGAAATHRQGFKDLERTARWLGRSVVLSWSWRRDHAQTLFRRSAPARGGGGAGRWPV